MYARALFLLLIFIGLTVTDADAQKRSSRPQPVLVGVIGGSRGSVNVSNSEPRADLAKRVPAGEIAGLEHHLFDLLNAARAENGLESLRWDENVAALARIHSRNMADYRFFNHRGTDGQTVDGRAADLGMGDWLGIGENIASMKGYDDPCAIAAANWMKSPAHRQNLLSGRWNQSAVGIAIAEDGTYYFTQVFMLR